MVSAQAMKRRVIPLGPKVSTSWKRVIPPWKEGDVINKNLKFHWIALIAKHLFSQLGQINGLAGLQLTSVINGSPNRKQITAMTKTRISLAPGLLRRLGKRSVRAVARLSTHTNCENRVNVTVAPRDEACTNPKTHTKPKTHLNATAHPNP